MGKPCRHYMINFLERRTAWPAESGARTVILACAEPAFQMFSRRDLYPSGAFFILGQKENVKFVEIPRGNGYFFPVFLL